MLGICIDHNIVSWGVQVSPDSELGEGSYNMSFLPLTSCAMPFDE